MVAILHELIIRFIGTKATAFYQDKNELTVIFPPNTSLALDFFHVPGLPRSTILSFEYV